MRKLSAVLVVASLVWLTGLSAIGPNVHLTVPRNGDVWQSVAPGLPIVPFGDDSGGSH
jgi:hypothetical protein